MGSVSSLKEDGGQGVVLMSGRYMTYDVISDIGFGGSFGFVEKGEDVGGLIQGFRDGLPLFGVLTMLYPFTSLVKKTWIGTKFLMATPEDASGIGKVMRFRDRLLTERITENENGKSRERADLLQM